MKYTKEHEWLRVEGDLVVVGITEHAATQLGDVVFVELPETDTMVAEGDEVCVIESVKAASDILAPVDGEIVEVNEKLADNPALVYGRMTGWGQDGPLAQAAGHDMNYVALTGLMSITEQPGHPPMLPPTVVGDAAGALGFAFGMVSALLGARDKGQGCVVDGAIIDVLAMLSPLVQLIRQGGGLEGSEPSVFHDSPFYDRYLCSDGRYITVGAIEPQFYALLLEKTGLVDTRGQV